MDVHKHEYGIAMEKGEMSLAQLIQKMKSGEIHINVSTVHKIILGMALGMRWMHKREAIHRNLTPTNVILTSDFEAKISDFHSTRRISDNMTVQRSFGPNPYMAPDLVQPNYTSKIDVFAFGVIVFELLTGNVPFSPCSNQVIFEKYVNRERPEIPCAKYSDLISQCWASDPSKRPSFDEISKMLLEDADESLATYAMKVMRAELKLTYGHERSKLIKFAIDSIDKQGSALLSANRIILEQSRQIQELSRQLQKFKETLQKSEAPGPKPGFNDPGQ